MPKIWLHADASISDEPQVPENIDLSEVFQAYESLRFDEQVGYASYMLRPSNRPGSAKRQSSNWLWYPGADLPLLAKRRVLYLLWISSFAALIFMHFGITVSHVGGLREFEGTWPHVVIVTAALLAIAVKTLSEGFALSREIERYEEYRSVVNGLRLVFKTASSSHRKVGIMMDLERAAFEEMRAFLRSNHEATFIM